MPEEAQSPAETPEREPGAPAAEPSETQQPETPATARTEAPEATQSSPPGEAKPSPPPGEAKPSPPPGEAKPKTPITEKPVPSAPEKGRTSQYVVTVDERTSGILKIERLNAETGERKELTAEEYAGVIAYTNLISPYLAGLAAYAMSQPPLGGISPVQAYFRGMADYFQALSSSSK